MTLPAMLHPRLSTGTELQNTTQERACALSLLCELCIQELKAGIKFANRTLCSRPHIHSQTSTWICAAHWDARDLSARKIVRLAMPLLSPQTQPKQSKNEV